MVYFLKSLVINLDKIPIRYNTFSELNFVNIASLKNNYKNYVNFFNNKY